MIYNIYYDNTGKVSCFSEGVVKGKKFKKLALDLDEDGVKRIENCSKLYVKDGKLEFRDETLPNVANQLEGKKKIALEAIDGALASKKAISNKEVLEIVKTIL